MILFMIDYISLKINFAHPPIPSGRIISIDVDGVTEWESPASIMIPSSFESKIMIRSQGALDENGLATEMFISGNPAKFLQGHNIFGSSDLFSMLREIFNYISKTFKFSNVSNNAILESTVSRIDFTKSIQFDNNNLVRSYIRSLGLRAKTRSGRPSCKGWTCTFQKSSRRWSIVCYSKGDELHAHKLTDVLIDFHDLLQKEADRLARIELRLKTLELKDLGMYKVKDITEKKLNDTYKTYIGKIEMCTNTTIPSDSLMSLSRAFRSTYLMWKSGLDVSPTMSETTFYRHRAELRKFGIDISIQCDDTTAQIIPINKIIVGSEYITPSHFYSTNLLFNKTYLKTA